MSIVVGVAVGSVALLIMQQSSQNSLSLLKEMSIQAEFDELSMHIQEALDSKGCGSSFVGLVVDKSRLGVPQTAAGLSPTTTIVRRSNGRALVTKGKKVNGLEVTGLGVRIDRIAGIVARGVLELNVNKTAGGLHLSVFDKGFHGEFPITFQLDENDAITACSTVKKGVSLPVPQALVHQYHDQTACDVPGVWGGNYWFEQSACHRFCTNGCKAGAANCTADLPGLGFAAGSPQECGAVYVWCVCIP